MSYVSRVGVLALGSWGTALAQHLARKGHEVIGWSHDEGLVAAINSSHKNPLYLQEVPLDPKLRATTDLQEAAACSAVVLAFPSKALDSIAPKITLSPETLIVSAIKGIEAVTLLTPLQYGASVWPECKKLCVLSGPSFAIDVALGRPVGVVAAANEEKVAREASDLFSSDLMKVYLSTDPLGVELGGIVKNVIAIATGICDGLDLGESARAGLVTRGLAEMMRLAKAMGADPRTLSGLSGLGDLTMTATSATSRNRTVGFRLGKGETLESIVASIGTVAEGVTTSAQVMRLAHQHGVEMPISAGVAKLLEGGSNPRELGLALLKRPTKREFEIS